METAYRVEVSPTSRAGCQGYVCKLRDDKIQKGELRMGVLVPFQDHSSWKWRHWGCTTPAVLRNWAQLADIENQGMDLVDGYDELPDELQEQVRRALLQGHVDDEDWRGDVELNRYNPSHPRQGMYLNSTKKKVRDAKKREAEEAEADSAAGSDHETPTKKPTKKKRSRAEEEEDAAAAPAKKGRKSKSVKAEPEDDENEPASKAKKTAKSTRVKVKAEPDDDYDETAKKPKAKKSAKGKVKAEPVSEDEMTAPPPAKKRGKKVKTEETDHDAVEMPTRRSSRASKPAKNGNNVKAEPHSGDEVDEDSGDEVKSEEVLTPSPSPPPVKKAKRGKKARNE